MEALDTIDLIWKTILQEVQNSGNQTPYGLPIMGLVAADDADVTRLSELTGNDHMTPEDLLPGARTVVSFYLPFAPEIAADNAREKVAVTRSWAVAYVETNALISRISDRLIERLGEHGIRAAAQPATKNFDYVTLRSRWSHKSIAVAAGIGSFGLHNLVITDAGCTGRFGSLVLDAELPAVKPEPTVRCDHYATGACMDCSNPDRICNTWCITEKCFPKGRIKIILIDQDLGL